MRQALKLSAALMLGAMVVAACGGGGHSSGGSGISALPPQQPGQNSPSAVTMAIKIPSGATSSGAKRPAYVSPNTQSIGVVVTNQGLTPSAAQYANVSSCPQVSGVTTCTVTVSAIPGSDTFAISAYSGQNGGGSVLSTGTITSTIVSGASNTTLPVTLGGVVASIAITPGVATLPLGQTTSLNVVAKDASGAAIVGTYDNPLTLTAANMSLSKSSITNSTDASSVVAGWSLGFAGSAATTVSAAADGVTGTTTIAPGTGFAYYQTGTNATTDNGGFKMIAGSNGKLYYSSLGPVVCNLTTNFCSTSTGAVHQFDPTTATDTEVPLPSEAVGLKFTSDGALWIAGGPPASPAPVPNIYRMAPGSFSSAALTAIPLPTSSPQITQITRAFAQDASGNLWFQDTSGHHVLKIPVAGPYASSSITAYALPRGPTGTPGYAAKVRSVEFVGGSLFAPDFDNGVVDAVNTSTGATTGQYIFNSQNAVPASDDSVNTYDSTNDGTYAYFANLGNWNAAIGLGDIERFNPSTNTFSTLPAAHWSVGFQPGAMSVSGSNLYYQELATGGLGVVNLATNASRMIPLATAWSTNYFNTPNGVAALADGTVWFSCYASAQVFQPLCVGHSVYLGGWSIFPGYSIALIGAGSNGSQYVGIMEPPTVNSAPFTVTSSNTSVCTIANASDHNFEIVGQGAGACSVTVTDKNAKSQTISVTVTTTSGTVQAHRGGATQ